MPDLPGSPLNHDLYLESGPKRKKTLAHSMDLVGCVQQFPTTDDAIAGALEMVRTFLRFLARHGDSVDPEAALTTIVAVEDLSGGFLGTAAFASDTSPINGGESGALLERLGWLRGDTLTLVDGLSSEELEAKPEKGRPIGRIVSHIVGAEYSYVTTAGFRIPGLHALAAAADRGSRDSREIMREASALIVARLRAMTDADRDRVIERSTGPWTARRMYRAMLEHNWEHCQEIATRLAGVT